MRPHLRHRNAGLSLGVELQLIVCVYTLKNLLLFFQSRQMLPRVLGQLVHRKISLRKSSEQARKYEEDQRTFFRGR